MYQCPIRAFFNFYVAKDELGEVTTRGINALYGPFLISTKFSMTVVTNTKWYQCPIRAFFNFYKDLMGSNEWYSLCQCPIRAFFNFYDLQR